MQVLVIYRYISQENSIFLYFHCQLVYIYLLVDMSCFYFYICLLCNIQYVMILESKTGFVAMALSLSSSWTHCLHFVLYGLWLNLFMFCAAHCLNMSFLEFALFFFYLCCWLSLYVCVSVYDIIWLFWILFVLILSPMMFYIFSW